MSRIKYILTPVPQSHCRQCQTALVMLSKPSVTGAAFYICWGCKIIAQIGVGEVKEEPK